MIDLLIDTIQSGIAYELAEGSPFYTDHLIASTTNKALNPTTPNNTVAVIEEDSQPIAFEICDSHSPAQEQYNIKIQILLKGADEAKVKEERRLMAKRLKMAFWRKNGNLFQSLLTLVDSGVGYNESVLKYALERTVYGNTEFNNQYYYASETSLVVDTQTNFT